MRTRRSTADRTNTSWFQRTVAVLATAAVLMAAPGIAQAAFSSKATGTVHASTLNLSTLTAASVTTTCTYNDDLKIQLTKRVDGANYHQVIVKVYGITLYTGELNTANNWTYQQTNGNFDNLPFTYEITAQYKVRVNGTVVNTWTSTPLTGARTC